ncbi:MAG: ester cyclase, partial [Streptosporangiaceae bacterium]
MSTTSQTRSTAYAVMQRIFDEGFAAGDGSVADELCSPDLLDHQFGTAGQGADAVAHVRDAMRDVHGAFPDIKFTIEDAVESGDTIWVR